MIIVGALAAAPLLGTPGRGHRSLSWGFRSGSAPPWWPRPGSSPSPPGRPRHRRLLAAVGGRPQIFARSCASVGLLSLAGLLLVGVADRRWDQELSLGFSVCMVFLAVYSIRQRRAVRTAEEREAVLAERARIAREIHDILAHSLSAQIVHLEGARLLLQADRSEEALDPGSNGPGTSPKSAWRRPAEPYRRCARTARRCPWRSGRWPRSSAPRTARHARSP